MNEEVRQQLAEWRYQLNRLEWQMDDASKLTRAERESLGYAIDHAQGKIRNLEIALDLEETQEEIDELKAELKPRRVA